MRWKFFLREIVFVFLALVFVSSFFVSASLGISPAIKEYNFVPGERLEIVYSVSADDPTKEIEIFADDGGLGADLSLSKQKLVGSGTFKLVVTFPDNVNEPGEHRISVGVREIPDESHFIGTAISIASAIKVYVPYPGRYAEASLSISDGNVDEQIPIELKVINRGKENLEVSPHIDFISESGENVGSMDFLPVNLESGEDRFFRKFLDTSGYSPGNYIANAVVDYGGKTEVNKSFRIGYLHVAIENFSEQLPSGGIQKFLINIASKWNGPLENVYADVNISNGQDSIEFRTPAVKLGAWSKDTLTGFIDTSELNGEYNTNITLSYSGAHTYAEGLLMITEVNYLAWVLIGAGVVLVVIIAILIFYLRKRGSKKKRK